MKVNDEFPEMPTLVETLCTFASTGEPLYYGALATQHLGIKSHRDPRVGQLLYEVDLRSWNTGRCLVSSLVPRKDTERAPRGLFSFAESRHIEGHDAPDFWEKHCTMSVDFLNRRPHAGEGHLTLDPRKIRDRRKSGATGLSGGDAPHRQAD